MDGSSPGVAGVVAAADSLAAAVVDRLTLSTLPVGVVVHAGDGRILRCNVAAERILGLAESQLTGLTSMDPRWRAVHEDGTDFPGETHPATVALRTGDPVVDVTMGVHKPDGSLTWITVSAVPVAVDAPQSTAAVIATFVDITEQVVQRRAAKESEERFRLLAENASDVVVRISDDGVIEWMSPSVTDVLGWDPEEWVGRRSVDIVAPDDVEKIIAGQKAVRAGQEVSFKARVRHKDGRLVWVESRAHWASPDAEGRRARVASWRDISEQVAVEEALAGERERFRLLAENASDVVFTADLDRRVTWMAPAVTATLGYEPSELLGTRIADLWRPEARLASELDREAVYSGHESPQTSGYVFELRTKSGEYRWMSGNAHPLTDSEGVVVGVVSGMRDVTDLVHLNNRREAILHTMLDYHALLGGVRDDEGLLIDLVFEDANDATCHRFGRDRAELIGMRLSGMFTGPADRRIRELCEQVLSTGEPLTVDHERMDSPTYGAPRWFDIRAVKVADRVSVTWRDVTEAYEAQRRTEESEANYRLLAENATDIVTRIGDGRFTWVSPSMRTEFGWDPDDIVGRSTVDFVHPDDLPALLAAIDSTGGGTQSVRMRALAKDGTYHWVDNRTSVFLGPDGVPDGRISALRVVDREVKAEQALVEAATHDDLTGLLTRREVLDRLASILSHPARSGSRTGIAFCDLDEFKAVNDRHGHGAGDEALRVLADRIRATVRESDQVSRFGGDEILVILDSVRDESDARAVAEKIRAAAMLPVPILGGAFTITLSIGITLATPGDSVDALIARADAAMYAAKNTGKNQVVTISAHSAP